MLINHCLCCVLNPKVTKRFVTKLGPKAQPSRQWDFNQKPSDSEWNALTHCATLPIIKTNMRNDKRFNNRAYSLFFLMNIFLKHLWLIPNILKWQDCMIFTKLVSLQTPSRSSHQRRSVEKGVLKNLRNFTGKHLYWNLFLIKLQTFRPVILLKRDSNTGFLLWNL